MKEKYYIKKLSKFIIISITVISTIAAFWGVLALKEKKKLEQIKISQELERLDIVEYLKNKYNKDFEVELPETISIGFAVNNKIIARCTSNDIEPVEFTTEREEYKEKYRGKEYEDGYKEVFLNNKIKKEFEGKIKDINMDAVFFVRCSYKNPIEDIYMDKIDNSKIIINIDMAIPIEKKYDEKDVSEIKAMMKKDYEENHRTLFLSVNFYDKNYIEQANKYYELKSISDVVEDFTSYEEVEDIFYDSRIDSLGFENRKGLNNN